MSNASKTWAIHYTAPQDKGGTLLIERDYEPSRSEAAISLRDYLLGDNFLLVDTPRGHPEPTVFLLNSYGYDLVKIEEST